MKLILVLVCLITMGAICNKPETVYHYLSGKTLDFASYTPEQKTLRFSDTSGNLVVLTQSNYERGFQQFVGLYGNTNKHAENYRVTYASYVYGQSSLGLYIGLSEEFSPYSQGGISVETNSYGFNGKPNDFPSSTSVRVVNSINYSDVYSLKAYKNSQLNSTDTATVIWNRQYGLIQFQYPNGKTITRLD